MRIRVTIAGVTAEADLNASETARAIFQSLPLSAKANRWGDEIYFDIPVKLPREKDARDVLESGELGYWPDGHAFCIFWGPTPSSKGKECRAYSPVNVFGKLTGDPTVFGRVKTGAPVEVATADTSS